ncbi:C-Jun-amino-terminal kinase-interacting protein 4 isoform X1 [Oryzias melastigma]|uniref:C-Jun-amino-terminal kinase-interacting protein 4 isoform X1 n=1 Tax=Oryzias melastigma TaxID=30732 RepID=UPI000CF83B6D|nr:C-Jun-amino-terminal kinase-interacting protein 4 isoform X1 [Oryzias melastigma]XP_024123179.1 C-Jun-amino-terminal kinase-interacting protein 4 isoform X1 [Oryzias melastigma]XP_024123180.1 C-Jun-amino-terminal kinase-interacting protein 4 isoform X1 [Oryzias melastigma]XP_024123181.1 C-Jun-amino-terminal kinase-interacting protein 4 isoform X1 [Oryzias melastigma]
MENSEKILSGSGFGSGSGEVDLDPDIVSEEAGKLYSELQTVIETHGEGVVEPLVPIFVWVLEGLATSKAQLREKEEEAEREKAEREELFERYHAEKILRKESQERYLELDDQIEQERRAMRGREKERERRERDLEKKARQQADQLVALEEQKAHLSKELSTLRNTHNKLNQAYRELMEKRKDSERDSPLRNHVRQKNADFSSHQVSECIVNEKIIRRAHSNSGPPHLEDLVAAEEKVTDVASKNSLDQLVSDIISSTPELTQLHDFIKSSTPVRPDDEEPLQNDLESSLKVEIREEKEPEAEEGPGEKKQENDQEEEEEEAGEDDSMEWDLRNTDSVFSELSELSQDYVQSVDRGASVRGDSDQSEGILALYEDLKVIHDQAETARKALLSRVVELTDDRSALMMEVATLQETLSRLEGRMKEKEEELKRLRRELEEYQSEDPDASLPSSMRHFSRSEMARVVMEKNQYKQRLFELQEAVRQSQTLRATKERFTEDKRSSVWRKFNRLFGLSKEPLGSPTTSKLVQPASPSVKHSVMVSPQKTSVSRTQADSIFSRSASPAVVSPRVRRRELYREIRSYIWGNLGKRQIHGWSTPLAHTQESDEPVPEPKDVPVLVQLRLLDQRDSTAKLNCAVAVPPEISGGTTCSVWVVSGPASCSDITVIDPARSNTVLDQFSLPPTAPVLCICAVPPIGNSAGSVWIGTQEGSILIHAAAADRRSCLQSVCLSEGVHSLTYFSSQVIAGLADGTLAFFSHTPEGWNLLSHSVVPLGVNPLQPIRCCLAKAGRLWVGYWNKVHVVDTDTKKVEQVFSVSERSEQQVRFLCAAGSGVWISCRLDPILRLFDWSSGRPLQEVDFSALVTKALGQSFLTLSPLQISSLTVISGRLWVGTGGGAIFSVPLSITSEAVSIPYCSTASALLSYHGHRQSVRFIISAPGCLITSPGSSQMTCSQLILSGGEGYINFRIGDDGSEEQTETSQNKPPRSERSHMIIWQNPTPPVPSPAL